MVEKQSSWMLVINEQAKRVSLARQKKKKEDMHKMAEANKAFAHYKW